MTNVQTADVSLSEEVKGRYYITDENQMHVHCDSIRKVSQNEYTYVSYPQMERSYADYKNAHEALYNLKKLNDAANMNHKFTMNYEELQPKPSYVIIDQYGNFVDARSIAIYKMDDGLDHWYYRSHSYFPCGAVFAYNSAELAESILNKLNKVNELAKFPIQFTVIDKRLIGEGQEGNDTIMIRDIEQGKKTLHKRLYREIYRQ